MSGALPVLLNHFERVKLSDMHRKALFMQTRGDMSRSWTLAAYASRTLVSLNYHTIEPDSPSNGDTQDIYGAIYTCYYLDKILSVLLLRSPSLPRLKMKPADLVRVDPQFPLSASLRIMVEFGQIQDGVLDLLFNRSERNDQVTAINRIIQDAYNLHTTMKKVSIYMSRRR